MLGFLWTRKEGWLITNNAEDCRVIIMFVRDVDYDV